MANLFPDSYYTDDSSSSSFSANTSNSDAGYKGSYKFDFKKGEFVRNPDGTLARCSRLEAYEQWCNKAMNTPVGFAAYSRLYGHELDTLSDSLYSREAIELEVKRMTADTLMVHPMTKDVRDFTFTWQNNGELYYEYTVVTVDEESIDLNNTTKVG